MERRKKPFVTPCATHGWHESVVPRRCELCHAISQGDLEGVRRWLTPENMESKGRRGWTPLVFACRSGQVEILRFLINAGADIKTVDNRGWSLLHHSDSYRVTEILLDSGVDVNRKSKYGLTPLLVSCNKHPDVVRLLLECGADVFACDTFGRTALPLYHYDVPLAYLLLEYFGDASVRCKRVGCRCQTTVLMCSYRKTSRITGIGMYDKYIMKMVCAGLPIADDNLLVDLRNADPVGLFSSQREAFRLECLAELERMRNEKLPCGITYRRIFHQEQSALRHPEVQQTLAPDHCNQVYPIYGETLRQRFVCGLRKLILLDHAVDSLEVHVPPLLPECIYRVLSYLETEDLKNLLTVCVGRQNLKKLVQKPVHHFINDLYKPVNEITSEAGGQ